MRKKCFFRLFRINAKRKNLKRNKNGTKHKQNKKEAKNCHHFRFKVKWSETCEKLPSFLLRSEMKENRSEIFSLRCRKSVFSLVFASEAKRKWNEAKTKQKRRETKKSEAKRKIFGSETKWKYTLLISHWSEAKRSKKNFFSLEHTKRMRNGSRFTLKRKFFFCKTGLPFCIRTSDCF
jgi:hypothetical protein